MPEFDIDHALSGDLYSPDDRWGICRFFQGEGFRRAHVKCSATNSGKEFVKVGLDVPDNVPWQADTPDEDIEAYAHWVESQVKRLIGAANQPVVATGWETLVGTTDYDVAVYATLVREG